MRRPPWLCAFGREREMIYLSLSLRTKKVVVIFSFLPFPGISRNEVKSTEATLDLEEKTGGSWDLGH